MILCVGTTPAIQRTMVFDNLIPDHVNRAAEVRQSGGGKSTNVARVLRTLGQEVLATGFLGGETGQFIRRELDSAGIRPDFVAVDKPTRICVTVVDRSAGTATELVEETAPVEPPAWDDLLRKTEAHVPSARAVVLSGSLPPGAPADFYAQCVALASAQTIPAIVDGRGQELLLALPHRPTVVKPNRSELGATLGRALDTEDAVREAMLELTGLGAGWALVTMGTQGALLTDGADFWRIPTLVVPVLSAIGSGDAFTAGLVAAIVRGQGVPDACRLGVACAAANAMTLEAGHVDANAVRQLTAQARVERL